MTRQGFLASEPSVDAVEWLRACDDSVIRWRTLSELVKDPPVAELRRAQRKVLAAPHVQLWLNRLKNIRRLHNSGNNCFENVAGKLSEFGLRAGMGPLDRAMKPILAWIADPGQSNAGGMMGTLNRILACIGALRLGYADAPGVRSFALSRLEMLAQTAAQGRYDILLHEHPRDLPKALRGRGRVIAPDFTPEGVFVVPYIYDLHMLAGMPQSWRTPKVLRELAAVLGYVLDERYQALPGGFGFIRDTSKAPPRFYAAGWKAGFDDPANAGKDPNRTATFVMRLEMLGRLPGGRGCPWFKDAWKVLSGYRTPRGTFAFPGGWLQEKREGYWVAGAHMGLMMNRRGGGALEVESTLRAALLGCLADR